MVSYRSITSFRGLSFGHESYAGCFSVFYSICHVTYLPQFPLINSYIIFISLICICIFHICIKLQYLPTNYHHHIIKHAVHFTILKKLMIINTYRAIMPNSPSLTFKRSKIPTLADVASTYLS